MVLEPIKFKSSLSIKSKVGTMSIRPSPLLSNSNFVRESLPKLAIYDRLVVHNHLTSVSTEMLCYECMCSISKSIVMHLLFFSLRLIFQKLDR